MKETLIKVLSQELNSLILQGHHEIRKTSIKDSIEQKLELKKMTNFCVEQFKTNLYQRMDQIDLTRHDINKIGMEVLNSYSPIEVLKDKSDNNILPGLIDPIDYEKIIKLFYKFCYDLNNVKLILGDNFESEIIQYRLKKTTSPEDAYSLDLLTRYAKNEGVEINFNDYPNQVYNSFHFEISVNRVILDKSDHYLEVISNDFLKLSYSDLIMAIPNNFIIQVKNNKPISVYVVLQNFISDGVTIRKVHDDGIISNLGSISNNSFEEFTEFFKNKF
jgi:hypothetical protein